MQKTARIRAVRGSIVSLTCLAAALPAFGFKIEWTGAGDGVDVYNEANWLRTLDGVPPAAGTVDPGLPINLIVEVRGVSQPISALDGPFTLGGTGVFQVIGSAYQSTQRIRRDTTPQTNDNANASLIITKLGQADSDVTALGLTEINLSLASALTLTDGGDPLAFSTVLFPASADRNAALTLTNESVADVVSEHLSKIGVGGVGVAPILGIDPSIAEPGDNLTIVSDGANGSIVSPVTTPIQPGDTDGDGDIDDADLGTSFANYTSAVGDVGKTVLDGDTDGDGDVDDADLGTSFAGYTGALSPGSAAPVPEPASAATVLLLAATAARRRRGLRESI